MDSFSKQAVETMKVHLKEAKMALAFFFLFAYSTKYKHSNKQIIGHNFKCFMHYNVNASCVTHLFQSLKNSTRFSVAFERKMPSFKKRKVQDDVLKVMKKNDLRLTVFCHLSQRLLLFQLQLKATKRFGTCATVYLKKAGS